MFFSHPSYMQVGLALALATGFGPFANHSATLLAADKTDLALEEAKEGEWSRWRGPNLDGISQESGLLKSWPSEGPPLAWRATGFGGGFASIAIANDHIYTMGNLKGQSALICANKSDGSILWSTPFGGKNPNCTPTVDQDRVYGMSYDGEIAGLRASNGEKLWQRSFQQDFGGKVPQWGFSESPLIDGDLLICTPGGPEAFVVALNKLTGETVWKATLPQGAKLRGHGGAGYASPVISTIGGLKQYVTLTGNGVVGIDAESGKLLWGYDKIANGTANIPTPIIQDDLVLCSSGYGDGGTALLKLTRKGKGIEAKEVYYYPAKELQNHHGGMILLNNFVFMGHGHNNGFPVCFNLKTGKTNWGPERGPGSGSAAVAYADGHLYFRYQDAKMALFEANPRELKLKGTFKIAAKNGESWPHPVIAGGLLYLRDQHELLVYDVRAK